MESNLREKLLEKVIIENNYYNNYLEVCSHFLVDPDEKIKIAWKNRTDILKKMMDELNQRQKILKEE